MTATDAKLEVRSNYCSENGGGLSDIRGNAVDDTKFSTLDQQELLV